MKHIFTALFCTILAAGVFTAPSTEASIYAQTNDLCTVQTADNASGEQTPYTLPGVGDVAC